MTRGRVWKFGDNLDTDEMLPGPYIRLDAESMAEHVLEGADPEFTRKAQPGDIIVAGKNCGCGSSRPAPEAMKAFGISAVIASSIARIFLRNAISIGLPALECPEAAARINQGDTVEVDVATGTIKDLTTGQTFQATMLPESVQGILLAGGLRNYVRQRLGQAS